MLDISVGLLATSMILFLVSMYILNKTAYIPLLKFMDDRKASIEKDLANARRNGADVDTLLTDADKVISSAKAKAASIREKAIAAEQELCDMKVNVKKKELEKELNEFLNSLDGEKETYRSALISQMPLFKESLKAKTAQL
jgi:F-type H+-transporting ATPase subunit b